MKIVFDLNKDKANRAKHGVSLAAAKVFDWNGALTWLDLRNDYGEPRQCALGLIGARVYFAAFVDRDDERRLICLRKANLREARRYDDEN
ncbi:MAG: BrnT family toxin [Pseudomonadota bacterium]